MWENKPPGIFALTALLALLPFPRFTAAAAVEGLFVLGTVAAVHRLLRHLGGPRSASLLAAAAAALACNLSAYNEHGLYTEIFLLWPAALSMLAFARALPDASAKWCFAAGVAAGAASLFKPPGLAPYAAQTALLVFLAARGRLSPRRAATAVAAGAAGVVAAWLPAVAYFGWHGGLAQMLDGALLYNLEYGTASQPPVWESLLRIGPRLQPLSTLVVGTAILVAAITVTGLAPAVPLRGGARAGAEGPPGPSASAAILILMWVLFDLIGAVAGGRNYSHYYLPLAASLSAAAGLALWVLLPPKPLPARRLRVASLGALLLAAPAFEAAMDTNRLIRIVGGGSRVDRIWEGAAAHLKEAGEPGQTLFTWNFVPALYLETGMRSPIRLASAQYLSDSPQSARRFGPEIITGLTASPPAFLVDGGPPPEGPSEAGEAYHAAYRELLARRYSLTYEESGPTGLRVYRRRARSP